ncbi:hypothetical protein GMA3_93 [Gordonia phage GMA3]|uniref:Uncharacterized protein n=1 Tax=Gordonia phage GMA3 TaxID=1647284 RepID=A0A0K0NKN1_9CAUD|nr:hypothetical protein AU105_gp093 [Gordonia phage GMA3]AKL88270.1 hypothetical protein GMA3_93 [Gordonia phage GMA3]
MRMTRKHVQAKIDRINKRIGFDTVEHNTVGAIQLRGMNGGYLVDRICNESGGINVLYSGSLRECAAFIDGMIAMPRTSTIIKPMFPGIGDQMKAGHKLRNGHELKGYLESSDGGETFNIVRTCC